MKITIPMEPVAKARARQGRWTTYTPTKTVDAENLIRWHFTQLKRETFGKDVPLVLTAWFYRSRPKSAPKKRIYPTTRPDWDNYGKLICDALQKFCYKEDSQIVDAHVYKRYAKDDEVPRIEIEILEVKDD